MLSPTALISHELSSSPLAKFFAAPLTCGEKLGKAWRWRVRVEEEKKETLLTGRSMDCGKLKHD